MGDKEKPTAERDIELDAHVTQCAKQHHHREDLRIRAKPAPHRIECETGHPHAFQHDQPHFPDRIVAQKVIGNRSNQAGQQPRATIDQSAFWHANSPWRHC